MRITWSKDRNDFAVEYDGDDLPLLSATFMEDEKTSALQAEIIRAINPFARHINVRPFVTAALIRVLLWLYDEKGLKRSLFSVQERALLRGIKTGE